MTQDSQVVQIRQTKLGAELEAAIGRTQHNARTNYMVSQVALITSAAASASAAILGIIDIAVIKKWEIGVLAALSTVLISASRQLGLQQKANWHYRKLDQITALRRRLQYQLPPSPSSDNVAAIAKAWSEIEFDMQKEWEDMQHESKRTLAKVAGSAPET